MLKVRAMIALMALGLLGVGIAVAVVAAPVPARGTAERFEFGELRHSYTPGGSNRLGRYPEKVSVRWVTSKATVEADSWEAMAKALNAPAAEKGTTEENHRMRVLDRLDAMGWDFVLERNLAVDRTRSASPMEAWGYRRKVGVRPAP